MKKITKLTEEQEKMIEVYREEWIKRGFNTDPFPKNEKDILEFCSKILERKEITKVIWAESPKDAWDKVVTEYFREENISDPDGSVKKSLSYVSPSFLGQFEAGWFAFFTYMREVLGVTGYTDNFDIAMKLVDYGPIYPLRTVIVVCDRPKTVKTKKVMQNGVVNYVLHCENGPAVEYRDGFKLYSMNGVKVPEWLAETPDNQIDPKKFTELDNVEVRREFLRKVGVERIVQHMKMKLMDKTEDGVYELYQVNLGKEIGKWPILKMKNPSIGVYHMEWVDENIKTVEDAIKFRNGSDLKPEILT